MEVFNFCWLTLLEESKKFSVFFDRNTCSVKNDIDENFHKPVNRIAYLYKFGSFNISFFQQCFTDFFMKAPDSEKIIEDFRSLKNLTICSMSAGPGTDIIGLLYSLYLIKKPLINSAAFKVISRHGSWRNLVNEMMSSSIISVPDASTCNLLECDFLKELSKKAKSYLKAADIILMHNSFLSSATPSSIICNTLERIHQLKLGALVFFIVSKEKSAFLNKLNSFGSFLYGPVEITLDNILYNEEVAALVGVKPLCSGTSMFAVWRKLYKLNPDINEGKERENIFAVSSQQQPSTELINSKLEEKDINSPILSMADSKREFSSDCIANSLFSSGNISSQIKKEKELVFSSNPKSAHKADLSETNFDFAKNGSLASVNGTDSLLRKKFTLPCQTNPKKKETNGNNMDSLLKNFESLITKFEGLIRSHDSPVKEEKSTSDLQCHENVCRGHSACSVIPCQFKGNGSICCCNSMMCYKTNHYCSANIASNLYKFLPQEGPCIVIPLQNLSNESLIQILSIISQNSSVNETCIKKS